MSRCRWAFHLWPCSFRGVAGGQGIALEEAALAVTRQAGLLIVAASGNLAGSACDVIPASLSETLAIGATGPQGLPFPVSSSGDCLDLWAPGVNIRSACGGRCCPFAFQFFENSWEHPLPGALAFSLES